MVSAEAIMGYTCYNSKAASLASDEVVPREPRGVLARRRPLQAASADVLMRMPPADAPLGHRTFDELWQRSKDLVDAILEK